MSQKFISNKIKVSESETLLIGGLAGSLLSTDRLLDLDALGVPVEELPETARKLLRQPVLPREVLHPFQALNKRASDRAFAFSVGSPLGRVMHPDQGKVFIDLMKEIEGEWKAQLDDLRPRFAAISYKAIEEIRSAEYTSEEQKEAVVKAVVRVQPDWAAFEASVQFRWTLTAVSAAGEFDASIHEAIKNSLVAVRDGAYAELIREVSVEARDVLKVIGGKDAVHPRTVARMSAVADKLEVLSFLGKGVDGLADSIRSFLAGLPKTGSLKGSDYDNFETLLLSLVDQRVILSKLDQGIPLIHVVETQDLFQQEAVSIAVPETAPAVEMAVPASAGTAVEAKASIASESNDNVAAQAPAESPTPAPATTAELFTGFALVEQPSAEEQSSIDLGALGFSVVGVSGSTL